MVLISVRRARRSEAGDILDGRTVASVQMSFSALSGQYLAFEADFTDGSSGIYRANLHGHPTEAAAPDGTANSGGSEFDR